MSAPQPTPYPQPSAYANVVERTQAFVVRVLWTALPFGSLGLLGWVQALRVARRRRTPKAWWWLAGLAGATVVECLLVTLVPSKTEDGSGAAAGGFVVTYIITASVYNWQQSSGMPRLGARPGPYPLTATAWMPSPFEGGTPVVPVMMVPVSPTPQPMAPMQVMPGQQPAAQPQEPLQPVAQTPVAQTPVPQTQAPDMAAEVQAELRELRGLLGGGDAR